MDKRPSVPLSRSADQDASAGTLSYGRQHSRLRSICKPRRVLSIVALGALSWLTATKVLPLYRIASSLTECGSYVFPENSICLQMHDNGSSSWFEADSPPAPIAWEHLAESAGLTPHYSTAYLHQRNNLQGQRIVVVEASRVHSSWPDSVPLVCTVLSRTGWFGVSVHRSTVPSGTVVFGDCSWYILYRGTSDPDDPSRFRIRYDSSRGFGTIEGALCADDSIQFIIKDGPLVIR